MAKFRQNHARGGKGKTFGFIKIIVFVCILAAVLFYLSKILGDINFESSTVADHDDIAVFDFREDSIGIFPIGSHGEIIHHKHYSLSYLEKYEQAEWVAYNLTKESIRKPNVPRAKRFNDDELVSTRSATYYDYRGSGYSRGHLAPAGDMAFDTEAMQESFYMSNMSPQISAFNGGIWNELENLVRDWAYNNKEVVVVTGPILGSEVKEFIGDSKVGVPKRFYKAIYAPFAKPASMIAFLIPNEVSDRPLQEYVVSVDELEEITDLNFFSGLLSSEQEKALESIASAAGWAFDESLYQKRIKQWNNR